MTITLRDISIGYGDTTVVHAINLAIKPNQTTALIGPGGSGKSSVVRLIGSSARGLPVGMWATGELTSSHDRLAVLPQKTRPSRRSLAEVLTRRFSGCTDPYRWIDELWRPVSRHAAGILRRVLAMPMHTLPRALRRLAEFTVIIADRDSVLLIDEPECGADRTELDWVTAALDAARGRQTIVLVSHYLPLIRRASDRAIFLLDGHIIEQGATARMFQSPAHPRTQILIETGG